MQQLFAQWPATPAIKPQKNKTVNGERDASSAVLLSIHGTPFSGFNTASKS
jgi:hypothetical protein